MHEEQKHTSINVSKPFALTIHTPLVLGTPPLSSGPTWARAVQARGRDNGHPKWYGTVCDNTVVYCSLTPYCSHLPPHREIRHRSIPFGLTEHSLLAEPGLHPIYRCAWESTGNHTQLGGISPRSNTPVHARHAMFLTEECVGVALAIY